MPVLIPLNAGTNVLNHIRLTCPFGEEIVTGFAYGQAFITPRRLVEICKVRAVILPKANGADVPVDAHGEGKVVAARALMKV